MWLQATQAHSTLESEHQRTCSRLAASEKVVTRQAEAEMALREQLAEWRSKLAASESQARGRQVCARWFSSYIERRLDMHVIVYKAIAQPSSFSSTVLMSCTFELILKDQELSARLTELEQYKSLAQQVCFSSWFSISA